MAEDAQRDLLALPFFRQVDGLIVRQGPGDVVPFAYFEGHLPTRRQARWIERHGFGLHIWTTVTDEVGAHLIDELPRLSHLLITGIDLDLGWLGGLPELVSLGVNGSVRASPNLSTLKNLRVYAGSLQGCESVFHAPNLAEADVDGVRDGRLPSVPTQLRKLRLTDVQGTRDLTTDSSDPQLEQLSVVGSRRFDANSLRPFTRLQQIGFTQAVGVTNLDALAALPDLRSLTLERCRDLEPIGGLLALAHVDIHIRGRGPFVRRMTELADGAPNWHFQ